MKNLILSLFLLSFLSNAVAQSNSQAVLEKLPFFNGSKEQAILDRHFTSENGKIHHYYFNQEINKIPVYNIHLTVHTNKVGTVLYAINDFIKTPKTLNGKPTIDASNALLAAALHLNIENIGETLKSTSLVKSNEQILINPSISIEPIKAKLMYLKTKSGLKLTWLLSFEQNDLHNWDIFIDAKNGEILKKFNNVISCNFDGCSDKDYHESHAPIGPTPPGRKKIRRASGAKYKVFASPIESPKHGLHAIASGNEDSLASPYNWHDVDGKLGAEYTITRGNNVFAYEDKNANNQVGFSPDGGRNLVFDYKYHGDFPDSNLSASITNLFYWNNIMHDVWYNAGFDEKAGNFQQNNYGRYGTGAGDYVVAQAQDGSGKNNANFNTQRDGTKSRMQMYIWDRGEANQKLYMKVSNPNAQYEMRTGNLGKKLTSTPLKGKVVIAKDLLACNALTNALNIKGKIALIKRGNCSFIDKVKNAQNAGALAVIMYNLSSDNFTITVSDNSITIPVVTISGTDGARFTTLLNNNPNLEVSLANNVLKKGRDSDFDNGIISHEYGHGISVRLTGGANNTGCLRNQEQMGEGWSDFFGLVMTHKPSFTANTRRGIGTYANNQSTTGKGIRNYPYSRSMSTNPATYSNIKTFSVPHGVGFVWCSMLYDMYWDMIDKHGFDTDLYKGKGGNNKCMKLVIMGLKLQPCSPGFVDGRDAILKADEILYKGENKALIWKTFARRGLGFDAQQGSTTSRSDGTQGFNLPPELKNTIIITKTAPAEIKAGEEFEYTIKISTEGVKDFNNVVVIDSVDKDIIILKNTLNKGAFTNNILKYTIPVLTVNSTEIITFKAIMPKGKEFKIYYSDNFENKLSLWKATALRGSNNWVLSTAKQHNGNQSWYVKDMNTRNDASLMQSFEIPIKSPKLEFHHYYNTEDAWDGGVLEISTDNGKTWEDLGNSIETGKYNGTISENQESSLSTRPAFTGKSDGFEKCIVNLKKYAGKVVYLRWFFASDARSGGEGWYVDDVRILSGDAVKNRAYVFADNKLINFSDVKTLVAPKDSAVSITEILLNKIAIYPNPGKGIITLDNVQVNTALNLYDAKGSLLLNTNLSEGKTNLNLKKYTNGVYFLRFTNNNIDVVKRYILDK